MQAVLRSDETEKDRAMVTNAGELLIVRKMYEQAVLERDEARAEIRRLQEALRETQDDVSMLHEALTVIRDAAHADIARTTDAEATDVSPSP
jgi:hypothetical protein